MTQEVTASILDSCTYVALWICTSLILVSYLSAVMG